MFSVFELDNAHANEPAITPGYYRRCDRFMAASLLARLQADEHAVFWAYDGHVCNAPSAGRRRAVTHRRFVPQNQLRDAYCALGFTWS